jgi:hypothetical protein
MALTAEQMIDAIHKARGFISTAAQFCGVSRQTFYTYLRKYATVQQALEDAREKNHDFVESKLMKAIDDGNVTAMIFYLKTQCKKRGYIERTEFTGRDGGPIETTAMTLDEWHKAREIRRAQIDDTLEQFDG